MFNNSLPVPYNQLDQSTFNGNLPNGNDRVPNIQLSQQMMQNQQIALTAIGYFRAIAQSTVEKSPMHVFCYNLLSQNGFQNQVYTQWCQHLVTFVEFLIAVKGYNTDDAIKQSAQRLYEAFMGMAFKEYPALQQVVPNGMWQGLQTAQALCQQIFNDCQKYQQGGIAAFQQQQQSFTGFNNNNNSGFNNNNNGGTQLPRIGAASVQSNFGSQPQQRVGMPLSGGGFDNNQHSGAANAGFYDEPIIQPTKALQPVEEISSDVYSQYPTEDYPPMNQNSGTAQQSHNNFTQQDFSQALTPEQEDMKVPLTVDEVVIDPTYFQPVGYKLNLEGLYDHFFNPGGIEIRPEHKSGWTVTFGDDAPYSIIVNPATHLMFHVRFPDGTVKEKAVEWSAQMEYMRHELNDELRRRAHRPSGIVVETKVPVATVGSDPITSSEVTSLIQDSNLAFTPDGPVILEQMFNGSTDMEVREAVNEAMSDLLGREFSAETPMPAVEYVSLATHYLKLTPEEFATIDELSKCADLGRVALDLKDLGEAGFDTSYYRFLNSRLTQSINRFMRENMSLNTEIDDFVSEVLELLDYLAQKKGPRYVEIMRKGANEIIRKAISVEDTDGGTCVIDYNVNFQLGWYLDELASLNVHHGKPVLVSVASHPTILETLRGMIKRTGPENIDSRNLRLITADGAVLELIRGYLVEKAMLLKLVK